MDSMNRREFLGKAAALAGAAFLAGCGEGTPDRPQVYGVDATEWGKLSPEERGNQAWKFLITPVANHHEEADRKLLLEDVIRVIERAERKGTHEHTVLHQALEGALKKNYARFILHYRGRGINMYNPEDAGSKLIVNDRDQITSSPEFLRSASRVTGLNVAGVGVRYNHSSNGHTTYVSSVNVRY